MRLIDGDELMEHIGRDKLDSREAIMEMIKNAPTAIDTKAFERLEHGLECYRHKCERLKGQVHALAFALRCNGVSGNEVTYEDY